MNGVGISHILVSVAIAARNSVREHENSLRLKLIEPKTLRLGVAIIYIVPIR
jgi:hypothetical protein